MDAIIVTDSRFVHKNEKMQKIIKLVVGISILVMFFVSSCNDETTIDIDEKQELNIEDTTSEITFNLLDYTPNVYHKYFADVDNTIGFSSVKSDPFKEHFNSQRHFFAENSGKIIFDINGEKISTKLGKGKISEANLNDIYGKVNVFKIQPSSGKTFKNGDTEKEVEMYVPKKLNITNPKVKEQEDIMPYCYYKDFLLEWNADSKNDEGLVVVVEYYGATAIPSTENVPSVVNTDIIEVDNGKFVLDDSIWEGIPNSAVVYLSLLRGNVILEEVDGEVVKFYAETHAELPLVLINDLNTLQ